MCVARDPAVTKIFSPLMTYSPPSRLAVVVTAAAVAAVVAEVAVVAIAGKRAASF